MNKPVNMLGKHVGDLSSKKTGAGNPFISLEPANSRRSKIGYLSQMDIFCDLTQEEMMRIERSTRMSACAKGKVFYRPQESGEVLFLLKKGRVQVYRLATNGRKLIVGTIGPGTFFGEMSLIGQGMYNAYAEAVEDCLLCVMSRAGVERLLVANPSVALRILEAVGRRLADAETRLEEMAFKSVPARLASLLTCLAESQGGLIEGWTHQELADMVGTYRETATQVLNDFKVAGLIQIERKKIAVINGSRLEQIAEE